MSTAVTRIQLKFSTGTAAPTTLTTAEPAYSYASNTFFIGSPSGDGVIAIGGKFYLDQQQLAWNHANAAFGAANNATDTYVRNHANSAFDTANGAVAVNLTQNNSIASAFIHANAAFLAANNATDTYVRNHANAAFDTANGAVAVNTTQNNSITVALDTANAAFSNANSYITYNEAVSVTQNNSITAAFAAANAATATDVTQNNSITSAFIHANSAFASANNIDGVNVTQNNSITVALNTANAAYTRANNSLDANTGGTITGDVIINANLFVNGTTTYVNTVNQLIGDNIITLNADIPQDGTPTQDSGFEIDRGVQPNSSFLWIESSGKWAANNGNASIFVASEATLTAAYNTANAASIRANNSLNANTGGLVTGNISVDGTITPNADVTWNLGSADKRWHSLFVGAGTIDIGGLAISNTLVNNIDTARFAGVQDIKISDAQVGSFRQLSNTANAAFDSANAAFANANSYITYAEAVNVTQNNSIAAVFASANVSTAVNLTQNNSITVALDTANAAFANANSYITYNEAVSVTQNTNITNAQNSADAAFSVANGAVAVNATQNTNITNAQNSANASFFHANAAFLAANNATDTYVRNHANAAFDTANSAVAVNTTQNNSISASFAHANAAFAQANNFATATVSAFNGVGDGTTTSFPLGYTPVSDASASVVTIDGIVQYEGTYTLTTANSSVNFSDAPGAGERVRVLAYTSINPYVLLSTGVTAGSYGNANTIAVFTTAANGQLTFATNTAIAIGASQITSGELGVTRGGTGAGTFTTNGVLIGQGTSAFTTASSSTEGHVLIINSSGAPVFGYINGGTF
jgi:hypothetical protein